MKNNKKTYTGIFRDGGAGKFAKRRFRERRKKLMERENKLMAITGVPYGPEGKTVWSYAYCPTFQEPSLMYLTGINQSEVVLLLDPNSRESDEILFVAEKDLKLEFWNGIRFGVGDEKSVREVQKVTGIQDVRDIRDLKNVLQERFLKQKKKQLGTFWVEGVKNGKRTEIKTDHNWDFKSKLSRWVRTWNSSGKSLSGLSLVNIMENHFDLRLPLDEYDVANTQKASDVTGSAFKTTLRNFRGFRNEFQVQGFIEGQMLMNSPYGLSFPSIVASGSNATILHYMKNDDAFARNELVLIDFGVRWMTMHADISRTVPASGRFNPLQKMLYEIVLKAQKAVQRKAKAGVTIDALNDICWGSINSDLDNIFRKAGGKCKLKYKSRPHGVSHLIGEQEHDGDPFRNYLSQPMKPGWLISNEPGLYGAFRIQLNGKTYDEEIGIRIEDNLLITETGCGNMSRKIPKSVAEIERLMLAPLHGEEKPATQEG
ncbi:MAG: aminopeptidase P N-terminal domain-containing protein [Nitrospinae bacterium]|nr:aminopeptidase P N-terminal domain-containing protein [Nitrospinota bacterium]